MGTTNNLHQVLRSLCFNTHWNYAIFWKLKHRARMILTWEDAYYDNPNGYDSSESKHYLKTMEHIGGGQFSRAALGLAVAKMSYHVYSLGEGIVGQVAVTGKHRWICADNQVTGSASSFEFADGWQSQFFAGIRMQPDCAASILNRFVGSDDNICMVLPCDPELYQTIVVVAVAPLGVVQLGSLNKVTEDIGVVTHIREIFLSTQDYSIGHVPSQIESSMWNSSSLRDVSEKKLSSDIMPACLHDTEKIMTSETLDVLMPVQCSGNENAPHSDIVTKHEGPEFHSDESSTLLQSVSNMMNVKHQEREEVRPLNRRQDEGGSSGNKDVMLESEINARSLLDDTVLNNDSFNDFIYASDKVRVDSASFPSVFLDAVVCETDKLRYVDINQNGMLNSTRPSDVNFQKLDEKSKFLTEPCYKDSSCFQNEKDNLNTLKFPAGCELHEALGPAFFKGSKYFDWAAEVNQDMKTMDMPDDISSSQLTSERRPEHLLEAMVANICHSNNDVNSDLSFCTSMKSEMASGKNHDTSIRNVHAINSEGCSISQSSLVREDKNHCFSSSSGIHVVLSPKGFSSTCPSSYSERFERSSEPAKNSKKRARPGESCRPRPRDRQLIQDRIKELRELVPNGAKCSIDSLLERAIKHMLFLQSVTKHADKLNKFADTKSKLHHAKTDALGSSSYEQGSSLAMEVGGHLKVHSILVENLSKNGQMLVEMLCEESSHFLEIAEAIRSLDLTILKGSTRAHGEKIWISFVVEGQHNKNMHRLDILWPLVQILQSKSTVYSL